MSNKRYSTQVTSVSTAEPTETHGQSKGEIDSPILKLQLLEVLTNGDIYTLQTFINQNFENPLFKNLLRFLVHYSIQVSTLQLIQDIIEKWAHTDSDIFKLDINQQDADGNTPLHLAASQSRSDVIKFLLDQPNVNECILNNAQQLPFEMSKNVNVAQMMQIERASYMSDTRRYVIETFMNRNFSELDRLFRDPRNSEFLNGKFINKCNFEAAQDNGNTLLHVFVEKKDVKVCNWLLDHGADPIIKNKAGLTPIDILSNILKQNPNQANTELKTLQEKLTNEKLIKAATSQLNEPPTYKAFLKKFTNFAQGYKLRWFVLTTDGKLSYYKDQGSGSKGNARGTLNLCNCYLHLDSTEKLKFEIIGGPNNSIKWQLKGNHPTETNNWVWAIQGAIRFARDKNMSKKKNVNVNVSPSFVMNRNINQNTLTSSYSAASNPIPNPNSGHSSSNEPNFASNPNLANSKNLESIYQPQTLKKPSMISLDKRLSSSPSINSTDIELSDRLTESGKHYVSKMIETRLESSSTLPLSPRQPELSTSGAVSVHSQLELSPHLQTKPAISARSSNNRVNTLNDPNDPNAEKYYDYDEEDDDGNVEEGGITTKFEKDEEYLKIEYGPYVEKLNVYQKTIGLQLDSISEILSNDGFLVQKNPEVVIVRHALKKVYRLVSEMNKLTSQRDEKLVSMLTKQTDVNNVWIQSVRDLEVELGAKSERLASIDKERKNLKKTLQKKLVESEVETQGSELSSLLPTQPIPEPARGNSNLNGLLEFTDNSQDTLAQIAKFISATKEEDEDSEADEFFDAEELMNEIDKSEKTPKEENINTDVVSTTLNEPLRTPSVLNNPVLDTPIPTIETDEAEKEKDFYRKETVMSNDDAGLKLSETQSSKVPFFAVSEQQREKEEYILKEKSFKGYEDGIRKKLNLDEDDRPKISLWSVLKSMVGKDMTKMTLPVTFNEPTSLLQRVAEDLEYTELLDQAATFEDSSLRLLYAAIFTASCYASTTKRVAKPFNPLLGETYEYTRSDKHYRFFTEQVSHHPPISATWTEAPKWDFYGESQVETKFNGRSFGVQHLGLWYMKLRPDDGSPEDVYIYKKPDNTVIGILVGNPQVDNHGEVRITNHVTDEVCILNFKARGWRSSGAFEVRGEVLNKKKEKVWVLGGHWNDSIYAKKVTKGKNGAELSLDKTKTETSNPSSGPSYDGSKFLVWKVGPRPDAPFHLTPFAITLNAPQPKLVPWLAPTDTRLRPDQRAMEDGEYNLAASEKHRLEEKQREVRKTREIANTTYNPKWFVKDMHPTTKQPYWRFKGEYWNIRKESKLAENSYDIF